jgi:rubrerythrin
MDTMHLANELLSDQGYELETQDQRIRRVVQTGIEIEQRVEALYLRVGRSFTYGPIRRLFEEYAAEVRDHARILSRHLRDMRETGPAPKSTGRRRRPKAAEGSSILTPPTLYQAFEEAFRAAEGAILFHSRSKAQAKDRYLCKFMDILANDHSFHLDILGHLLADIRDRPMHLTPGRKLAPVDVPWVAALFEGVVPPWCREDDKPSPDDAEGSGPAQPPRGANWFLNYM